LTVSNSRAGHPAMSGSSAFAGGATEAVICSAMSANTAAARPVAARHDRIACVAGRCHGGRERDLTDEWRIDGVGQFTPPPSPNNAYD
jgi:hypothetical protein